MPIINDKALYEKAKKIADEKYSKPSAYKSGFIVKTYKEMGGTYTDDGKPKNLKRWYKERWSDVGGLDYPVLRPTIKVSKKTPLLPSEISNLTEQIKLKQKIKGKNLPPFISQGISMKGKKRMYGGMDKLPQEALHEISGFLRPPRVHEVQQQFPGYTHRIMPVEHGVREQQRIRDRNLQNLGVMTANRQERLQEAFYFVQLPVQEQIAEIEEGLPILHVREMYAMTNSNLPYELLIRYPAIGGSKVRKGGMIPLISADRLNAQYQQNLQQGGPTFQESEATAIRIARIRGIESVVMYMIERVAEHTGKSKDEIAGLYMNYIDSLMPQDDFLDLENDQISQILDDFIRMVTAPSASSAEGKGLHKKKGGMPRKDKDIILPPPAVARAVTGEATRPFQGQEVYADYPEAPSVFSDFILAEEQREIARAEQRDQANIDSLFRQYGQMYPGGLSAEGSATAYNDFTERYLPSRRMNESYVANLPPAERGRIINAFLTQRRGMCVASGKGGMKKYGTYTPLLKSDASDKALQKQQDRANALEDLGDIIRQFESYVEANKTDKRGFMVDIAELQKRYKFLEKLDAFKKKHNVSNPEFEIMKKVYLKRGGKRGKRGSGPSQSKPKEEKAPKHPAEMPRSSRGLDVMFSKPIIDKKELVKAKQKLGIKAKAKPIQSAVPYRSGDIPLAEIAEFSRPEARPFTADDERHRERVRLDEIEHMLMSSFSYDVRRHSVRAFNNYIDQAFGGTIMDWYELPNTQRLRIMNEYLRNPYNF